MFYTFRRKRNFYNEDYVQKSVLLSIFSNRLIQNGKKSIAYRILYSILHDIHIKTRRVPIIILEHAIRIVVPSIQLKSRRIGGAVYQVPIIINFDMRVSISIHWILTAANNRYHNSMISQVLEEIIEAIFGFGGAIRKQNEVYRIAETNKAFVRYRLYVKN